MLSLFPQILFLEPLGITLLRVTVAIAFLSIAYIQFTRREEISHDGLPVVGSGTVWVNISAAVIGLVGTALLLGYATQLAALLGLLISIKHAILAKRYPHAVPLCRGEYILIAAICLFLTVSGAGAFAFDLPL